MDNRRPKGLIAIKHSHWRMDRRLGRQSPLPNLQRAGVCFPAGRKKIGTFSIGMSSQGPFGSSKWVVIEVAGRPFAIRTRGHACKTILSFAGQNDLVSRCGRNFEAQAAPPQRSETVMCHTKRIARLTQAPRRHRRQSSKIIETGCPDSGHPKPCRCRIVKPSPLPKRPN